MKKRKKFRIAYEMRAIRKDETVYWAGDETESRWVDNPEDAKLFDAVIDAIDEKRTLSVPNAYVESVHVADEDTGGKSVTAAWQVYVTVQCRDDEMHARWVSLDCARMHLESKVKEWVQNTYPNWTGFTWE